jgi:hypothetical protein
LSIRHFWAIVEFIDQIGTKIDKIAVDKYFCYDWWKRVDRKWWERSNQLVFLSLRLLSWNNQYVWRLDLNDDSKSNLKKDLCNFKPFDSVARKDIVWKRDKHCLQLKNTYHPFSLLDLIITHSLLSSTDFGIEHVKVRAIRMHQYSHMLSI